MPSIDIAAGRWGMSGRVHGEELFEDIDVRVRVTPD